MPRAGGPLASVVVGATLTDLGTLGGAFSRAHSVNDSGYVVGYATPATGPAPRAVRWSPGGAIQDLGLGDNSAAFDINAAGQIVGYTYNGPNRAFLWDPATGARDLGTLGGASSIARAINNKGDVVGYSENYSGDVHAFVWTASGGMRDLGALAGSSSSHAMDIIDDGTIVGYSTTAAYTEHAVLWNAAGAIQDLGALSATANSFAYGVNSSGQVVGGGYTPGSPTTAPGMHAFVWTPAAGMRDLGTLGGTNSALVGVNDKGEATGYSNPTGDGVYHAIMWTQEGGMVDLGGVNGGISNGGAVNARGQVVGSVNTMSADEHAARWDVTFRNDAPIATAGGPYHGAEGAVIAFAAVASDADGDPLSYAWDFGDGSAAGRGPTVAHSYAQNGTYTATVTVTDGRGGNATATTTATVANVSPVVTAGPDATVAPRTVYALTATFSDPGATDSPWTWTVNWGDGSAGTAGQRTATGAITASHAYSKPGTYSVSVSVTDKDGATGSAGYTVTVARPKSSRK